MNLRLKCSCGTRFTTSDELRGRMVRCPKCRKTLRVPETVPAGAADSDLGAVAFVTEEPVESPPPIAAATSWQSRDEVPSKAAGKERRGGAWKWFLLALVLLVPAGVVGYLIILPYFQPKDPREVVARRYLDAVRRGDLNEAARLSVIVSEHPRNITGVEQVVLTAQNPRSVRGKFQGLRLFHDEIDQQYTYNSDRGRFEPKDELGLGLGVLGKLEEVKKKAADGAAAREADPARQKKSPEDRDIDDLLGTLGAFSDLAGKGGGLLSTPSLGPTYEDLIKKTKVQLSDAEKALAQHYSRDPAKWKRLLGDRSFLELPDLGEFDLQEVEIVATIRTEGQSLGEPGRPIKLRLVRFSMGSIDTGWRVWQAE